MKQEGLLYTQIWLTRSQIPSFQRDEERKELAQYKQTHYSTPQPFNTHANLEAFIYTVGLDDLDKLTRAINKTLTHYSDLLSPQRKVNFMVTPFLQVRQKHQE